MSAGIGGYVSDAPDLVGIVDGKAPAVTAM